MPSPFPGMDPFLESPDWFPDLHDGLIFLIKEALQTRLPSPYYARTRHRVWLDLTYRPPVEPDVDILRAATKKRRRRPGGREAGGVAVAEPITSKPVIVHVRPIMGEPIEESYLVIHRRQGTDDTVVAVIEILSPSNKTPGEKGRALYVAKQQETIQTTVHLIEIDLLRAGAHATAVPLDLAIAGAGSFDYHVCVHRSDHPTDFFVYPVKLQEKLPAIAIPPWPGTLMSRSIFRPSSTVLMTPAATTGPSATTWPRSIRPFVRRRPSGSRHASRPDRRGPDRIRQKPKPQAGSLPCRQPDPWSTIAMRRSRSRAASVVSIGDSALTTYGIDG
jgi:hypothetical protein